MAAGIEQMAVYLEVPQHDNGKVPVNCLVKSFIDD
jgi:hypothetical protein